MQKPVQDIYTACIFGVFFVLVAMTAVMGNSVLQQSGIPQTGMTRASINHGDIDATVTGLTVHGGLSECEVIYHLASENDGALRTVSEEGQEEAPAAMHFAVYTCVERAPTLRDYI